MATTLMMGSDPNLNLQQFSQLKKPPANNQTAGRHRSLGGGRRKSKAANESSPKKKQSLRGMGVERLERLRIQEIMSSRPLATSYNPQCHHTFADPTIAVINSVPTHHVPFANFVSGSERTNNGLLVQRVGGDGGLLVQRAGAGAGAGADHHHYHVGLYGTVGNGNNVRLENVNEASEELSSTPNIIRCFSDHCGVFHKKKRVDGKTLGCSGVKDVCPELPLMNGCGLVGFDVGNNQQETNDANKDFGTNISATHTGYALGNNDLSHAGVVAVHQRSGRVLMEYEFFPEKGGGSTLNSSNELVMKRQQLQSSEPCSGAHHLDGEAYCVSTTAGVESSSSIDLTLKLYH